MNICFGLKQYRREGGGVTMRVGGGDRAEPVYLELLQRLVLIQSVPAETQNSCR